MLNFIFVNNKISQLLYEKLLVKWILINNRSKLL